MNDGCGHKGHGHGRRNFLLGAAGLGGLFAFRDPGLRLIEMMVEGLIASARAEDASAEPNYYVNVHLDAAPNRTVFDQFLTPKAGDGITLNPQACTAYTSSGGIATGTQYMTSPINGVNVPWLWNFNVANGAGQATPMAALLQHMIAIRGYGTGIEGHTNNGVAQRRPAAGGVSIAGAVADASSSSVFAAVTAPSQRSNPWAVFASAKGLAATDVASVNDLMKPFILPAGTATIRSAKERYATAIEIAQAALKAEAESAMPGAKVLNQNLSSATALMKKGVSGFTDFAANAMARYRNAVDLSARPTVLYPGGIPGISDAQIVSDGTTAYNMAGPDKPIAIGTDVRSLIDDQTATSQFVDGLAVVEYALSQGYCRSFEIPGPYLNNLLAQSIAETAPVRRTMTVDEHFTGHMNNVFLNSMYFRGVGGGILELVNALKGYGLFDKTVIHLSGDFGRSAHMDGTGSDHGYDSMAASVFTGMVTQGPIVVGNVYKDPQGVWQNARKPDNSFFFGGSWGLRAPMNLGAGMEDITPTHVAASIATLLNLPQNPWDRQTRLWDFAGGGVKVNATTTVVG